MAKARDTAREVPAPVQVQASARRTGRQPAQMQFQPPAQTPARRPMPMPAQQPAPTPPHLHRMIPPLPPGHISMSIQSPKPLRVQPPNILARSPMSVSVQSPVESSVSPPMLNPFQPPMSPTFQPPLPHIQPRSPEPLSPVASSISPQIPPTIQSPMLPFQLPSNMPQPRLVPGVVDQRRFLEFAIQKENEPEPQRLAASFPQWPPDRMVWLTQRMIYLEAYDIATMKDMTQISQELGRPLDEVIFVVWHLQRETRRMARDTNGGMVATWAVFPMPPRV